MLDKTLVQKARLGDAEAFCELVERYHGTVLAVARARCGNYSTAEDIVQEAFLRAYLHLEKLRSSGQFPAWVCRITHNLATDFHRKNSKMESITEHLCVSEISNEVSDPDTDVPGEQMENDQVLADAIQKLPVKQREVILLHLSEKLSHKEIARRLNVHASTVGRRYKRAAASLMGTLGESLGHATKSRPRTALTTTTSAIMAMAGLSVGAKSAVAANTASTVAAAAYTTTIGSLSIRCLLGAQNMFLTKPAAVVVCAAVATGVLLNLRATSIEDVYFDKDNPEGLSTTRMVVVHENGEKLPICFDGRKNSETQGRLYAGWFYPEVRGSYDPYEGQDEYLVEKPPRLVEIGSKEEQQILAAVQYWLDGKVGPSLEKQFQKASDYRQLPHDHQILWHAWQSVHRYYANTDREVPVITDGQPRVSDIHQYVDAGNHSGSVGFLLTTNDGRRFELCFDGRYVTETPGQLFVGGTYVTDAQAKLVPNHSDLEKTVLQEVNSWLEMNEANLLLYKTELNWNEKKMLAVYRSVGRYEATWLDDNVKGIGKIAAERMTPSAKARVIGISHAPDGGSLLIDAVTAEGVQIAFRFSYALKAVGAGRGNGHLVYRGHRVEPDSAEEKMLLELCQQIARQNLSQEDYRNLQDGDFQASNQEQKNIATVYAQLQHYLKHFKSDYQ